jgi:hypothetical protein
VSATVDQSVELDEGERSLVDCRSADVGDVDWHRDAPRLNLGSEP